VVVACEKDGKGLLHVRDLVTGEVKADLPQPDTIEGCAWHPGGRLVAVACSRRILLWDVVTRKQVGVLEGHKNADLVLAFNHAGDRLLSNDWSGILRVWDWRTGRQVLNMPAGWHLHSRWFHADDQHLFSQSNVGTDGKLWLLRFAAGRELRTLVDRRRETSANYAQADRGGRFLVLSNGHGQHGLAVVDRSTGEELG